MPFASCLFCDGEGSKISIGKNCRINGTYIHARDSIIIGDNCVFASGVSIMDSNGHETYSSNRTQGADKPKEVIIGNNVWIGVNAIILKGSIIGDNCIVAANSVAKGVYPANSIISNGIASVVSTIEL